MVEKHTQHANNSEQSSGSLASRMACNISARRRSLGLTQAALAEKLGVETETLSRFERGKHLPSLATLERLAGLLMTTVGELLEEAPKEAEDEALMITAWLSALSPEDRVFARSLLKQCCDHLAARRRDPDAR